MNLSDRSKIILRELVNMAKLVSNHEIRYGEKKTWKNAKEKAMIAKELDNKGYINFLGYSGTYKIHCIVTEKAFKEFDGSVF